MAKQKTWEELELKDDFMFAKVMRDPGLCKEMLELLLGFKISKIEYPEEQKTIDISYDSRSVRLDVYVQDEKDTVYNVEIQTTDTKELPKRSRYYQGMIDLNQIEKGEHYKELKKSYVIFICTFDLFGKDYYRYTFENLCKEDNTIALNDQTTKLFFNTSGTIGDLSEETIAFLKYVGGAPSDNGFVKRLQDRVNHVRENQEWRVEYMTLLMRDQENRELGRQEGLQEGRQEGLQEGRQEGLQEGRQEGLQEGRQEGLQEGRRAERLQIAKALLKKGLLSDTEIMSVTNASLEELQEAKDSLLAERELV